MSDPDRPRPALSPADQLLRTLVIAWDLDDDVTFRRALDSARLQVGIMAVLPRTTIRRTES